jgi:hypothetical protein
MFIAPLTPPTMIFGKHIVHFHDDGSISGDREAYAAALLTAACNAPSAAEKERYSIIAKFVLDAPEKTNR